PSFALDAAEDEGGDRQHHQHDQAQDRARHHDAVEAESRGPWGSLGAVHHLKLQDLELTRGFVETVSEAIDCAGVIRRAPSRVNAQYCGVLRRKAAKGGNLRPPSLVQWMPRICRASAAVATWSPRISTMRAAFSTSAALLGASWPLPR